MRSFHAIPNQEQSALVSVSALSASVVSLYSLFSPRISRWTAYSRASNPDLACKSRLPNELWETWQSSAGRVWLKMPSFLLEQVNNVLYNAFSPDSTCSPPCAFFQVPAKWCVTNAGPGLCSGSYLLSDNEKDHPGSINTSLINHGSNVGGESGTETIAL